MEVKKMSYPIYTSQQIRQLEQALFDSGIVSHELMFNAGKAAFSILQQQWPQAKKIVVLCGAGNNGGDGYVVAYLAQQAGYVVEVFYTAPTKTTDAQKMMQQTQDAGVIIKAWHNHDLRADVIVDALFGIGLSAAITGIAEQMITVSQSKLCAYISY
jgi:hydroxyethylthiazole kinase-like uncharacterized protein yjeF